MNLLLSIIKESFEIYFNNPKIILPFFLLALSLVGFDYLAGDPTNLSFFRLVMLSVFFTVGYSLAKVYVKSEVVKSYYSLGTMIGLPVKQALIIDFLVIVLAMFVVLIVDLPLVLLVDQGMGMELGIKIQLVLLSFLLLCSMFVQKYSITQAIIQGSGVIESIQGGINFALNNGGKVAQVIAFQCILLLPNLLLLTKLDLIEELLVASYSMLTMSFFLVPTPLLFLYLEGRKTCSKIKSMIAVCAVLLFFSLVFSQFLYAPFLSMF